MAKTTWSPADSRFTETDSYTVSVELTAAEGYQFTGDTAFTVNGQAPGSASFGPDSATVELTFPGRGEDEPDSDFPFADVPTDAYYADAVLWAVEEDITQGTSATTFSPNNDCTRAQIVTFLYRYLGE